MAISNMVRQIEHYLRDRALFSADILANALKWQTNYTHPLAVGYRDAKLRLDGAISQATQRTESRRQAYEQLRARMDFAVGVLFGLMGPFVDKAVEGLKTSMLISEADVDTRVLTQWYSPSRNQAVSFDTLLDRARIRQSILNYVVERGIAGVQGQIQPNMSPAAGGTGSVPTPSGSLGTVGRVAAPGFTLPEALTSGEFGAAEFEQSVQDIFNRCAVELHDRYAEIFDQPVDVKRRFLENATKTVLACPPANPITDTIPPNILAGQLFGMIAGNYMLSFHPSNGRIWPSIGYDLAYTINEGLSATGHSIITNNPKMGFHETFPRWLDPQMVWDGHIEPVVHVNKIREIGQGATAVLNAYMQAVAMS